MAFSGIRYSRPRKAQLCCTLALMMADIYVLLGKSAEDLRYSNLLLLSTLILGPSQSDVQVLKVEEVGRSVSRNLPTHGLCKTKRLNCIEAI